jgi:hypothetical protein
LIDPAAAARRNDRHVGAEAVDRPVLQTPGEQAAAGAVIVREEINGKIFDKEARLVLEALLVERVQDRVTRAVRGGAGTISHVALGILGCVPTKPALIDRAGLGAAERHAEMLELDDRRDRLAAQVFDRVLIAEPVGAPDGIEHVPTPVVLLHVAECGADAALRGDGVAASREDFGDAGGVEPRCDHAECCPQSGATGAEDDDVKGMVDDVVAVGHRLSSLPAEKEFEHREHAGASEHDRSTAHQQLGRDQPGTRVHVIDEDRAHAHDRMR